MVLLGTNELMKCHKHTPVYDNYRKTSNISHTLVGSKIVDNSDVVGAAPTSSFST